MKQKLTDEELLAQAQAEDKVIAESTAWHELKAIEAAVNEWRDAVAKGETILGFDDWCIARAAFEEDETAPLHKAALNRGQP